MSTQRVIRELDVDDAAEYQELRLRALRESPTAFSSSYEDEVGRTNEEIESRVKPAADGSKCVFGAFVVEQRGERLAGMVTLLRHTRPKLRHCAEIAGMYVAPEQRKHRLGRALLETAIARARSLGGVLQIKLAVTAGNTPAQSLYASLGFVRYGVEPRALIVEGRVYDEELYVLPLDTNERVEGDGR